MYWPPMQARLCDLWYKETKSVHTRMWCLPLYFLNIGKEDETRWEQVSQKFRRKFRMVHDIYQDESLEIHSRCSVLTSLKKETRYKWREILVFMNKRKEGFAKGKGVIVNISLIRHRVPFRKYWDLMEFSKMPSIVREVLVPHNPVFFRKTLHKSNVSTRSLYILLYIQQYINEIKFKVHKNIWKWAF